MSVGFRPFEAADVVALDLQPSQHFELGLHEPCVSLERGRQLEAAGPAWTAIGGDGRVLCVAGFGEEYPVQANAWAMFTHGLGGAHVAITRYARARIAASRYRRLQAFVEADNFRAIAWAKLVGLELAHVLHCYGAASKTHLLFERIR